jgi:hypothetical protein
LIWPAPILRVTPTAIIHLDMDAFFASVEQRDSPELRRKPVIVGGDPRRGVVLAASYEVRPFGVHSAMPMNVAMRRAPKAIVVPPRMTAYEEASDAIFAILSTVTLEMNSQWRGISAALSAACIAWQAQRDRASRRECHRAHRDR